MTPSTDCSRGTELGKQASGLPLAHQLQSYPNTPSLSSTTHSKNFFSTSINHIKRRAKEILHTSFGTASQQSTQFSNSELGDPQVKLADHDIEKYTGSAGIPVNPSTTSFFYPHLSPFDNSEGSRSWHESTPLPITISLSQKSSTKHIGSSFTHQVGSWPIFLGRRSY